MFSYYGTKRALAHEYPAPKYDIIIEPFAGAAAYSCVYADRYDGFQNPPLVLLYDTDPIIVATWQYLIAATRADILDLPDLVQGQRVTDFDLPDGARYLMGFAANPGSAQPKITASARCRWNQQKLIIADRVDRIKHWSVTLGSFDTIPDIEATWFIDPPYQKAGKWYRQSADKLDFQALGTFCQDRKGQVIVCEQDGADWLPFQPLKHIQGSRYKSLEVWWSK